MMIPVFIGGCSRSGTTLLGGMLGGHPDCIATPESPFKIHPLAAQVRRRGNRLIERDIDLVLSDWFFATWNVVISRTELIGDRTPASLGDLMQRLVAAYARRNGRDECFRYWIDHTPANIRYVRTLLEHFPTAKIIHLVRDGRAVAASVMKLDWGPNTPKDTARWWTSYVSFGLAAEHALPQDRILRVRYEDLITAPRETLERIGCFCGFDIQPRMFSGQGFAVPAYTARQHRLVAGPLQPERIDSWKRELTERQIEIFEHYTGEALDYLGYELQSGLLAQPPSTYEKWNMELSEIARRSLNKCLFAIRKKRFAA
jgi:hypothetical protein